MRATIGKGGHRYPRELKNEFDRAKIRACNRIAREARAKRKK